MLASGQLEQIRQFADEVARREGCLLYDLEFHDGPGRALRVFIDKEGGSVSIDDCANVSRGLNLRLDVEDVIPGGAYDLEVSSPGLDRKLTQLWHFEKVVGQTVQLRYQAADEGFKSYEGKLTAVDGSKLAFENSKGPFSLEFSKVQKARVVIVDAFSKKKPVTKKDQAKKGK